MESQQTQSFPPTLPDARQTRALYMLVALLGLAVVVLLAVWLIGRGSGSSSAQPLPKVGAGPAAVSSSQLEALAKQTGHDVYWAGSRDGTYELTRTTGGRIFIRYLASTDEVGDATAKYLTIGTYPQKNAFRSIQRAAKRPGAVSLKLPKGGLLVFNQQSPKSVYFGYPGAEYQVEVYDPSPAQARTLVLGGAVKPVE
jgi:hypothetical protein